MSKIITFLSLLIISTTAFSQLATQKGTITTLIVHNAPNASSVSQRLRIGLSGSILNASCSTDYWVINLNNEAANAQYAFLLANYAAGKEVRLTGNPKGENPSETCLVNQEVVRNVSIN